MQCNQFEARLNELLDQRCLPDQDTQLCDHSRRCPSCRELLDTQRLLFQGLAMLDAPPLDKDFTDRVVAQVVVSRDNGRSRKLLRHLLAVAAMLVIAFVPAYLLLHRKSAPREEIVAHVETPETVVIRVNPQQVPPPYSSADIRRFLDEISVRLETARLESMQPVDQFAVSLRPIAASFTTAYTTLRRALPFPYESEAEPQARRVDSPPARVS